jgi:NodT family efflux transporter outer membrane factor (OMF) lipoprotein
LALSGCVTVPTLEVRRLPLATADYDTAFDTGPAPSAWPQDLWWRRYGDAQLDALIEEGLAGSPTYRAAAARVRRADALAEQAGSNRFPELYADGSAAEAKQSYNNGIPPLFVPRDFHANGRATLGLSFDPDLWGRNRDALAAATSESVATRADQAQARLTLTTGIASAYADLARYWLDRDAAVAAANIRQQTAELVRARRENGLETRGTAQQSLAAQLAAQADIIGIDESIALTQDRIAALTGAGPGRGARIARPTIALQTAQGLPPMLALDLIARRPEIVAARIRVEAALDRESAARKDFYPNINLTGFAGYQSLDLKDLVDPGSTIASFGLAVHLPIFEAGRLQGAYRASRADYDSAVATYDGAIVQALQDVADTLASRRTVEARLAQTQAAERAADAAYRSASDRYAGELAPYLTVLSAQDALIANQRGVADLSIRVLSLDIALVRALGGGFSETTSAATQPQIGAAR